MGPCERPAHSIRYAAGMKDAVIYQIGLAILCSARALTQLGGGVAIAPAITALECDGVFPPSVNQRSAQPHHHGSRHDRRPIERGVPNRQIGLRQDFGKIMSYTVSTLLLRNLH